MSEGLKLSDQTISILSNFADLNNSIWLSPGQKLSVWQSDKGSVGEVVLKEQFPSEFAIYDTKLLLKTLRIFKDPTIHFSSNFLEIKEGQRSIRYQYADTKLKAIADSRPPKDPVLPEIGVDFTIPETDLKQIADCSSALGLPDLMVENAEDGNIRVVLLDSGKTGDEDISNRCTFVFKPDMAIGKFCFKTKMSFIKVLSGTYQIKMGKKASLWTNTNAELALRYWICILPASTWEK